MEDIIESILRVSKAAAVVYVMFTSLLLIMALLETPGVFLLLQNISMNWKGQVLFITAHPDDECMFFAPSILEVIRQLGRHNVHILCLTNGNFYNLGKIREAELIRSCLALGMMYRNIHLVDNVELQDGDVIWDWKRIIETIKKITNELEISQIITFDAYGVSGHSNHRAIFDALLSHKKNATQSSDYNEMEKEDIELYSLTSVSILRKYVLVFDLGFSFFCCHLSSLFGRNSKTIVTLAPQDLLKPQSALYEHESQFVWFRKLYGILSRYMYLNTFEYQGTVNL